MNRATTLSKTLPDLASFGRSEVCSRKSCQFPNDFEKIGGEKDLMGGRGSGRSASFGFLVDKCEEFQSIDLSFLRKENALTNGNRGQLTWSRRGEPFASIRYVVEPAGLRLIYRTRSRGSDWQDVNDLIPFEETPTQFGGLRRWFACPGCQKRCRIIYGGSYFRCRNCHGLKYESQYEDAVSRATSQRHKLRQRLGQSSSLDDPFPDKPKGMHWKTYQRLVERDEALGNIWISEVSYWLSRTGWQT
ncbi:MAG: hypothetical protein JXQ99_00255 [Hyphomicrobiaceae bacterium]